MENIRKHRDIKLVTTRARRTYLVLEPNYRTVNFFFEKKLNKNKIFEKSEPNTKKHE